MLSRVMTLIKWLNGYLLKSKKETQKRAVKFYRAFFIVVKKEIRQIKRKIPKNSYPLGESVQILYLLKRNCNIFTAFFDEI
jgi:hypothetical protein